MIRIIEFEEDTGIATCVYREETKGVFIDKPFKIPLLVEVSPGDTLPFTPAFLFPSLVNDFWIVGDLLPDNAF